SFNSITSATAIPTFTSGDVVNGSPSFSTNPTTSSSVVSGGISSFSAFPVPTSSIPVETTIFF
ncbi:uncharacterized protein Gasu_52900, partial [Galdieria sulphuraria]